MALETPATAKELSDRIINDVFLALIAFNAKPSLKNSWLNSFIVANANRIFDFYFALNQAALEALPDTAIDNLDRWAAIWGLSRTPGQPSTGVVNATGTLGSTIIEGTVLVSGEGKLYTVESDGTVAATSGVAVGITRVGQVATVTLSDHGLTDNVPVTISGATETEYNVVGAEITVIDSDTFTYAVVGSPATPATGSPAIAYEAAALSVRSVDISADEDQDFDTNLQLQTPIVGVDDVVVVNADGIGGGADLESDDDLRDRLLDRIQNPVANFNVAQIKATAKTVPGVTRVFVEEVTPAVGDVTIYFMRDNDVNPIPDGTEVAAVNTVIQAIRPANSASGDVTVAAPTAVPTAFTFSALSPNTSTMRTAITNSLREFFSERTVVGEDVLEDAYRSAIFNTVDPTNGAVVASFTLSTPSGDITIASGEIGTLGTVTFP